MIFIQVPAKNAKQLKPILEGGKGNGRGYMYDRQKCSEKRESVIPHFNYIKVLGVVCS